MDLFTGHEPVCTINIHWSAHVIYSQSHYLFTDVVKHNFEWVTTLQKLSSVNIKFVKCSTLLLDLSVLLNRSYNSTYVSPFVRSFVYLFIRSFFRLFFCLFFGHSFVRLFVR